MGSFVAAHLEAKGGGVATADLVIVYCEGQVLGGVVVGLAAGLADTDVLCHACLLCVERGPPIMMALHNVHVARNDSDCHTLDVWMDGFEGHIPIRFGKWGR